MSRRVAEHSKHAPRRTIELTARVLEGGADQVGADLGQVDQDAADRGRGVDALDCLMDEIVGCVILFTSG